MGEHSEPERSQLEQPTLAQATPSEKTKPDWKNQIDAETAFRLVDSILPFEACLYHQILPLSLEGSHLKLGMVNPSDSAALDYVRRILAYMNCSLVLQSLASDVHYAALSAYLSYADQQRQAVNPTAQPVARRIAKKLAEQSGKRGRDATRDRPQGQDVNTNPTLVVDSPNVLPVMPVEEQIGTNPEDLTVAELPLELPSSQPHRLLLHLRHLDEPPEMLVSLPPVQLLEELLGRVLSWGIGRLYLESKATQGRILWSQNGVVQAVLEDLPIDTLTAVIQELKQLTQLPLTPVQRPKQVEIDRIYQDERVLLRLRLMPAKKGGGEEATLQVLRGAALRFYRQQQLVTLGQEALSIAQQLQQKLGDISAYSRSQRVQMPEHLHILPELDRTLQRINHRLNDLQNLNFQDEDEEG